MSVKYWLMKSEPITYSIDHLKKDKATWWGGVRNYQARNFMMKDMQAGDWVLFYHSNCERPGIAGLAKVLKAAEPDETQFDPQSDYYDGKAAAERPIWFCVQIGFVKKWNSLLSLSQLKEKTELDGMMLLKKGQRLSVQPVSEKEFFIVKSIVKSIVKTSVE